MYSEALDRITVELSELSSAYSSKCIENAHLLEQLSQAQQQRTESVRSQ
jgi:hypothetical protein